MYSHYDKVYQKLKTLKDPGAFIAVLCPIREGTQNGTNLTHNSLRGGGALACYQSFFTKKTGVFFVQKQCFKPFLVY